MNTITNIIAFLGSLESLIGAVVGVVIAAVIAYHQIKNAFKDGIEKGAAIGALSVIAENDAEKLSEALKVNTFKDIKPTDDNVFKQNVVAQSIIEREPKLLKKMKLKDFLDVGNMVNNLYQGVIKPVVKLVKK